jgi:hypothetical protein
VAAKVLKKSIKSSKETHIFADCYFYTKTLKI